MLKVLEVWVYSLYQLPCTTRNKVFLTQKVQIQPFIKISPIGTWDNLKSQLFFPRENAWFRIRLSYLLWNWVSKSQHTSLNEIIIHIFFFFSEMFLDKLYFWLKNLFYILFSFFGITCFSVNPLRHRLEYIPHNTILLLRQHLEIFSMQF